MGLIETIRQMEPGTMVHVGSKSNYIDIAPAREMLRSGYFKGLDETLRSNARENAKRSPRLKREMERYLAEFKPLAERNVINCYPLSRKNCMAVIVEGTEIGKYAMIEEKYPCKTTPPTLNNDGAQMLAIQIIRQAATDLYDIEAGFGMQYYSSNRSRKYNDKGEVLRFFRSQRFHNMTKVDPEYIIRRIQEAAAKTRPLRYDITKTADGRYYACRMGGFWNLSKPRKKKSDALSDAAQLQGIPYKSYMKARTRDGMDSWKFNVAKNGRE